MAQESNHFSTVPGWISALAVHEAERIYDMMPRMMGERAHVISRLSAGIVELLVREQRQQQHAA
jgi:hypothetical protein